MGIFDKGVKKTNRGFFDRLSHAIIGRTEVDDDVLDAIEEALLATDMGVDTTMKIIENLEGREMKERKSSKNLKEKNEEKKPKKEKKEEKEKKEHRHHHHSKGKKHDHK